MLKESLSSFKEKEVMYDGEFSTIYRLPDGRLLKVLKKVAINEFAALGLPLDNKITNPLADDIEEIHNVLSVVYDDSCCGYTMEEIEGQNLEKWDKSLSLEESLAIETYYTVYANMEKASEKCDKKGIVLPDLATASNTMVLPNGNIRFIDRESIQFGKADVFIAFSFQLGEQAKYIQSPKFTYPYYRTFKPELNKTSLTYILFLLLFHLDLSSINQVHPQTGVTVSLEDVFHMLGIKDIQFMNKVACNLSMDENGSYLAKDVYRLMQDYSLEKYVVGEENIYIKRLVPKRAK